MLGFKIGYVEVIRIGLEEQKRLERERQALIEELEGSLGAEVAEQVMRVRIITCEYATSSTCHRLHGTHIRLSICAYMCTVLRSSASTHKLGH
jgi:hypothetical protein